MDEKILSDWGWRRNDTHDETAREIYESVIHVNTPKQYNTSFSINTLHINSHSIHVNYVVFLIRTLKHSRKYFKKVIMHCTITLFAGITCVYVKLTNAISFRVNMYCFICYLRRFTIRTIPLLYWCRVNLTS